MTRMTNATTQVAVAIVDGFPVTNDGKLVYDEQEGKYVLDLEHTFQVAKSMMICANAVDFGAIFDDRTKKNGRSFAKDETFVKENPKVAPFGDEKAIAKLMRVAARNGIPQKCDVNYNSHHNSRNIDPNSKRTHLIFAFLLERKYVPEMIVEKDLYIKISFTKARNGVRLHLESLHYGRI